MAEIKNNIPDISVEKFAFASTEGRMHDQKFDTKPVGYFRDAFRRFRKNKASVVAAVIILLLLLFSIFAPIFSPYTVQYSDSNMSHKLPKAKGLEWLGWDGCEKVSISAVDYWRYMAIAEETGNEVIKKTYRQYEVITQMGTLQIKDIFYDAYVDSYTKDGLKYLLLTTSEYEALQAYQDENNVQIIYPFIPEGTGLDQYNANRWYATYTTGVNKGLPQGINLETGEVQWKNVYETYDGTDAYKSKMRVEGEGNFLYNYATRKQANNYEVRVSYYDYYRYIHGRDASFIFGSDQYGKDIFTRLAAGARFSLLFAVAISVINLTIGAIYGAIEGYYGGAADMIMERVSDILSGVPFMVVVTLFKLHILEHVGAVVTLLFAFVTTGWIGMASTVRMQFYRFKNQEYVLAARTLGARDFRVMFKHVFPNSLGTIVTSCVLVIPGVIFSESSLSYLGILNLESGSTTSVGTLMANGQGQLSNAPHIILFPALFIALLMISFNLFGNGLRDAFNPSLRGSEG